MEINLENFVTDEMKNEGEYKIINLSGVHLCVFKCGEIYRWLTNNKKPYWKTIFNIQNTSDGFNTIGINGKNEYRQRLICYAF